MSPTETDANPVVLIVEDEDRALELRIDAFADAGFIAIGVQSPEEALREMRGGPAIDVVLTDIRLDKSRPDDKSGVQLASRIKDTYGDIPVAAYSAVFGDSDVRDEREVFDAVWPKGAAEIEQIDDIIAKCLEYARGRRRERQETAFEVHERLRRRHEEEHPDIELMRELSPGSSPTAPRNDAILGEAGYRLKLLEAEYTGLSQPVIVWLLDTGHGVDAEVYGQPALYEHGRNDSEAIARLIDLMGLYVAEVGPGAIEAVGPALSLTAFLRERLSEISDN
jgi:CheY-like chemotaxis protein